MSDLLIPRRIANEADDFLGSFRVLIINGPRQSGKTTLLRQLNAARGGTYLTLDDNALRAAAQADPDVFVSDGDAPIMIDEVQRGGDDLVFAIKRAVDGSNRRGQFVLAGSTRFLSTPSLTESLAGRAAILEVWPFAQDELTTAARPFLETAFDKPEQLRRRGPSDFTRADYFDLLCRGGYPEAVALRSARARHAWFRTYQQAVIDTDIREMARIDEPSNLARLLALVAAHTAQEFNQSKASSDLQLHRTTVSRYLTMLETVFLVRSLPAWSRNLTARAAHRPKLHLTDTGLAAYLLGVDPDGLTARVSAARGPLVESFVVNELAKQATWCSFPVSLHHWRISRGPEVDLVLERANGRVLGVEVKSTDAVDAGDFRGLAELRDRLGDDFVHGFVCYTGTRTLSFGDRLTAIPISALWDS